MSAAEQHLADEGHGHATPREDRDEPEVSVESWSKRIKRRLAASLARVVSAAIARLESLRTRLGGGEEALEERPRAKHVPPAPPKVESLPAPVEAAPVVKGSHRVRNFLTVAALVLLASAVGAGASYTLLSRLLKDQSLAIESHEQEIKTFQLEEQERGKKLADMLRQIEAERKLRTDMEARLVEAEQGRLAAEAKAKQGVAEAVKPEPLGKTVAVPHKEAEVEVKLVGRPSKASSFRPPGTGNCTLAGSDPAALKRCLDEYNRK